MCLMYDVIYIYINRRQIERRVYKYRDKGITSIFYLFKSIVWNAYFSSSVYYKYFIRLFKSISVFIFICKKKKCIGIENYFLTSINGLQINLK